MIISVGGRKGGCGKTTLITNLAALAAMEGHSVALLDADPKPDAAEWATRRQEHDVAPIHVKRCAGDIDDAIIALANSHTHVFIDTGGFDGPEVRYAMAYSNVFLAPFNASTFDLYTARDLSETLGIARPSNPDLRSYSVLASASNHPNSVSGTKARQTLSEFQRLPCLSASMHALEIWRTAADQGLGVCELKGMGHKACDDITAIASEILLWS